ncbi:40S ribosomal protein S27 [Mortierella alpina]|nr:40S ribosomal protein S27 [Mortierella alpina]
MTLSIDILNPSAANQARTHKLKRVVQSPNSFYMDVNMVLSQPTGGKAKLSEGVSYRKKAQ